jgi:hypothetical protein
MPDEERKVREKWPCGCVAYGGADDRLDVVFCRQHYRAWLEETAVIPVVREDTGERRHTRRISV